MKPQAPHDISRDASAAIRSAMENVVTRNGAEAEQRRLGEALKQAQEAIVLTDTDMRFVYVNPAFTCLFGYAPDEIAGRHIVDVMMAPAAGVSSPPLQEASALRGCGACTEETCLRAKDGRVVPVCLNVAAVRDGAGAVTGYVGAIGDLTERKRSENAMRHRVALESLVTHISTHFTRIDFNRLDENICEALEDIGQFMAADRCYLFQFSEDGTQMSNTHEWCASGVASARQRLQAVPAATLPWFLDYMRQRRVFRIPRVVDLPPEAAAERKEFQARDIQSLLVVPIACGESLAGFLGFDAVRMEKKWTPEDIGLLRAVGDVLANALKRREAEQALRKVNRALKTLSACNGALVHAVDEPGLLANTCRAIVETGGYRLAWIGYLERDKGRTVRPVAHAGFEKDRPELERLAWADASHDADGRMNRSDSIALSLSDGGRLFGVLNIQAAVPEVFDHEEIKLLQELAANLAYGIVALRTRAERHNNAQMLRNSLEGTVAAIAATVEMRDPYTAGHERRVARLAVAVAREMGLSEQQIEGIHFGALIHDLGKIQTPAEILSKPGRLNAIQFELIKTHPQVGYDILKDMWFPWPIAQMVLQHHERLDGSGYPAGLKGGEILIESRILTVADVAEAMYSHRPYRPALGIETALAHITEKRGVWYDPGAVDACVRLLTQTPALLETGAGDSTV